MTEPIDTDPGGPSQPQDAVSPRVNTNRQQDLPQLSKDQSYSQNTVTGGVAQFGNIYNVTIGPPASDDGSSTPRDRPRRITHSLPQLNERSDQYKVPRHSETRFTGRQKQIDQIEQLFASPKHSDHQDRHKIVVMVGLGGSGKTQIALRYAERHRTQYWGVFWIDASSRISVEQRYINWAGEAGVGKTWTVGKDWLSERTKPWLLILDNVDDSDMEADILEYLPSGERGHVLITTRLHDMVLHATAGSIELGRMNPEEATELLLKSAYADATSKMSKVGTPQEKKAANGIASALGYLAIALNLAGVTIRHRIYSIQDYLSQYLGDRDQLINSKIPKEEVNVIATWEIPFKQIEQQQSQEFQDAVVLICMFAFLHFDSISEDLLESPGREAAKRSPWFDQLPDLFKSGPDIKVRLRRALSVLADRSIIERDAETGTCSIHPVVHRWVKSRIDSSDKLTTWLPQTLCLLSCCSSETLTAARGLSLLPHVEYCLDVTYKNAPNVLETVKGMYEAEVFASMYAAEGAFVQSAKILRSVLASRQRIQGRWHEDTLKTKRNLSWALYSVFDVKAAIELQVELLKARFVIRTSLLDYVLAPKKPMHLPYLLVLDDMVCMLLLVGQKAYAKQASERAVGGLRLLLDDNDPRLLNAIFNLGNVYIATGDIEKGQKHVAFVVEKRKEAERAKEVLRLKEFPQEERPEYKKQGLSFIGFEEFDTFLARESLGMSYLAQDKHLPLAERLVQNVLDERSRVLGKDHPYSLWSVNNLSRIYCRQQRYTEAAEMLEKIVPIVKDRLGTKHVGMHITKGNLARAHALSKNWQRADKELSEILPFVGKDHPEWFDYMYGSARIKSEIGETDQAIQVCQDLIEFAKKDGPASIKFRMAYEVLGHAYWIACKKDELASLKLEHPWLTDERIQDPLSVLSTLTNV